MQSQRIHDAYESVRPDAQTQDRLLTILLSHEVPQPHRHPLRTALLIAAVVALLAAVAAVSYAAYQRWTLPKPESYTPTEHGFLIDVHSKTEYTQEDIDNTQEKEPLSDEAFLEKAVEILELAGKSDVDTSYMTVVRQEDMRWSREEADVRFGEGENMSTVMFDAESGALIMLTDFDLTGGFASDNLDREAAEALARYYYSLMPVPQGYELKDIWEDGDVLWTYSFCRRVSGDLFNEYEMVRICINPFSGTLCALTVFDVPLLDDHEPGDVPLTQDQAEKAAGSCKGEDLSSFTLKSAEVQVVTPNWHYTEYSGEANLRISNVSRLAWTLVSSREMEADGEIWEKQIILYIDYYTGELLGGYAIK